MGCNEFDVTSDKIVLESGSKYITDLLGDKNIDNLSGSVDKLIILSGQKEITYLTGSKFTYLSGDTKTSLSGSTLGSNLLGSLDKNISLLGTSCDGKWYILVDTTLVTVDSTMITVDITPT